MSDQNIPSSSSNSASDSTTETMSTAETLGNIFFDPGATFESLRKKPRFLVVALIMVVMFVGFSVLLFQKVNFEEFMRQQIEKSPPTCCIGNLSRSDRIVDEAGRFDRSRASGIDNTDKSWCAGQFDIGTSLRLAQSNGSLPVLWAVPGCAWIKKGWAYLFWYSVDLRACLLYH